MDRRKFIGTTGVALSLPLVGCLGNELPGAGAGTTTDGSDDDDDDTDDNDGGNDVGEMVSTETIQLATRTDDQDWHEGGNQDVGRVIVIDSESRMRAVLPHGGLSDDRREAVRDFLDRTDFETDVLLYVQSVGPNLCHDRIEFQEFDLEGCALVGIATVQDTSDDDEMCAQAVAYPSALVRVEFDGTPTTETALTLIDGWGNEGTVRATAKDALSPDPEDLEGYVRPDEDPAVVPDTLECERGDVERLANWIEEDDIEWGAATDEEGSATLALRVHSQAVRLGETVRITMTNVSDAIQYTGNRHKYSLEVYTEDGWQDVRVYPAGTQLGFTDEALAYRPGGGLQWTFELTEDGVIDGYAHEDRVEVCPDLSPGRYRFVFWEPPVAVAFSVTE